MTFRSTISHRMNAAVLSGVLLPMVTFSESDYQSFMDRWPQCNGARIQVLHISHKKLTMLLEILYGLLSKLIAEVNWTRRLKELCKGTSQEDTVQKDEEEAVKLFRVCNQWEDVQNYEVARIGWATSSRNVLINNLNISSRKLILNPVK